MKKKEWVLPGARTWVLCTACICFSFWPKRSVTFSTNVFIWRPLPTYSVGSATLWLCLWQWTMIFSRRLSINRLSVHFPSYSLSLGTLWTVDPLHVNPVYLYVCTLWSRKDERSILKPMLWSIVRVWTNLITYTHTHILTYTHTHTHTHSADRIHTVIIDCAPISFLDAVGVKTLETVNITHIECTCTYLVHVPLHAVLLALEGYMCKWCTNFSTWWFKYFK